MEKDIKKEVMRLVSKALNTGNKTTARTIAYALYTRLLKENYTDVMRRSWLDRHGAIWELLQFKWMTNELSFRGKVLHYLTSMPEFDLKEEEQIKLVDEAIAELKEALLNYADIVLHDWKVANVNTVLSVAKQELHDRMCNHFYETGRNMYQFELNNVIDKVADRYKLNPDVLAADAAEDNYLLWTFETRWPEFDRKKDREVFKRVISEKEVFS